MKILIIEDEKLLAESLAKLLEANSYAVDCVYDGLSGRDWALTGIYDLIIMDVMLPGMNGYQLTSVLRAARLTTPILMLTAKSELSDRITGLESGADYYLGKPFDRRELLACVSTLLRRQQSQKDILECGNSWLDLAAAYLCTKERKVRLSPREFDLMRQLLLSQDQLLSKETLLIRVWGLDTENGENSVEVYIGFLRKKLKAIGSDLTISAVRGRGYSLEVQHD